MRQREVQDDDGTRWSCVQALAGLGEGAAAEAGAAQLADGDGRVPVVCTPSGGAQSVRAMLDPDWAEALDDDALRAAIAGARREG